MIRVVVVDDQPLIRAGFTALLAAEDDITVVGQAADGREALMVITEQCPDVVLLDVQMPVLDGIGTTEAIASDPALAQVHVVILTNYGLDEYVFNALRAGATGFLVKDTEPADLLHAVRVAARGDALLGPSITRRLIEQFVAAAPAGWPQGATPEVLTHREREVLALVGRGLTNDDIAKHLVISPATVKTHVGRTMAKLYAHDRAQLVVAAYETGLVTPRVT
jgi:DNA-binding NarL/FixJ family response regulator